MSYTSHTVQTPLGALTITPTSASHIHVCSLPSNVGGLVVGTQENIYASVHVFLDPVSGVWGPHGSSDWHFGSRWLGRKYVPQTATTIRKVSGVMLDAVRMWASRNGDVLNGAEVDAQDAALRSLDSRISTLQAEIETLQAERDALMATRVAVARS